ncbi:MAG: hypothetical protein VB933_04700 [Pseudomonadales bacterium]
MTIENNMGPANMSFAISRIRAKDRNFNSAHTEISNNSNAALEPASLWGAFHGLFGLASNELVVVSVSATENVHTNLLALDSVAQCESLQLEPTVRPVTEEPVSREGLYVFRFFDVAHKDVEEIAELSRVAWESFEHVDAYSAEPQGLFCQTDRSQERGRMLLVTWYDGFNSWQASRNPAPEARENFQRRHRLTNGTVAYATRLIVS